MRPVVLAASAVAVFLLMTVMFASLGTASPLGEPDRCRTCHPVPHAEGFSTTGHAEQLRGAPQGQEACSRCHRQAFCSNCHG